MKLNYIYMYMKHWREHMREYALKKLGTNGHICGKKAYEGLKKTGETPVTRQPTKHVD